MEIKTKFYQRIFLGAILLLILIVLNLLYSFSLAQYLATAIVFLIVFVLTFKKHLYKITKIQGKVIFEFKIFGFIKQEKVYKHEDIKFEIKQEVTYRGGTQRKLTVLYKTTNTSIIEIELKYLKGDIDYLIK